LVIGAVEVPKRWDLIMMRKKRDKLVRLVEKKKNVMSLLVGMQVNLLSMQLRRKKMNMDPKYN
jgi:hypothetical protein